MKRPTAVAAIAALLATAGLALPASAQHIPFDPAVNACGASKTNFTVTRSTAPFSPQPVPAGKALVYIVEAMPDYSFVTKKVNIGLDGTWLGATDSQTYISFAVSQGTHHLCTVYQGHLASMDDEGRTLLLHLDAEPGKVYYFRYHALFLKDSPGIAFFDQVDEDEGLFLLQSSFHATSTRK
jgi:hypothetical protein